MTVSLKKKVAITKACHLPLKEYITLGKHVGVLDFTENDTQPEKAERKGVKFFLDYISDYDSEIQYYIILLGNKRGHGGFYPFMEIHPRSVARTTAPRIDRKACLAAKIPQGRK